MLTAVTPIVIEEPCNPSPCGENARCTEHHGMARCTCIPPYMGDPYRGCRPECVLNSECAAQLACINTHCRDPCPGTCGVNAECSVVNHIPICSCMRNYEGNPFEACRQIIIQRKLYCVVQLYFIMSELNYNITILFQLW
jgi:hypothetical protein